MNSSSGYTKAGMMRVCQILEEFRQIYPDMQTQTAVFFVTIAMNPGITMKELMERTGTVQSTCSRNVSLLSEWLKHNKPGYGLVQAMEDPVERRRKIVKLTPKGERLAAQLDYLVSQPLR
ncbi:hypothetical protein GCM10007160_18530 [Litchfieldella qijiaojingensis]|uniref:MarR family transcriptional regulator n=1 Tax=Litchfieldella qijiaojingensis TaxID=980347 RepID=A0ABQ2YSU1_9GAMM|nr:MarR family winged helix-turn-helix transcriptional regulator [Halomonas qijiaojingensis]GGX91321.1 hypothetical protein GCM10007160_18530 [Halomonas qijiaojingensis]